jgi:hypothetical protein
MERNSELLSVVSVARPKRAALLIDPSMVSQDELDYITTRCTQFWGGGYWPIIPVSAGTVSDDWREVLSAFDPDAIYAIGSLDDAQLRSIAANLCPMVARRIPIEENTTGQSRFYLPFTELDPLDNLSVLPFNAARQMPGGARKFLFVKNKGLDKEALRFACRNLGFLDNVMRTDAALAGVPVQTLEAGEMPIVALLKVLSEGHPRYLTPHDLACLYAPRAYDVKHEYSHGALHLVVGDSNAEAIYAWNRKLFSTRHNGTDVVWMGVKEWEDEVTLAAVARWVRFAHWHPQQQMIKVLSGTLSVRDLEAGVKQLRDALKVPIEVRELELGSPPFQPESRSYHLSGDSPSSPPSSTVQQIPSARGGALVVATPPPFQIQHWSHGSWMVDLDLDARVEVSRFANRVDRWRLPRRRGLARLFFDGADCRITKDGWPTTTVRARDQAFLTRTPTRQGLVQALLVESRLPIDERGHVGERVAVGTRQYRLVGLSEQGLRYDGLVDLFGGLAGVEMALDEPFIRALLREAAGKPAEAVEQLAEAISERLRLIKPVTGSVEPSEEKAAEGASDWADQWAEELARVVNRTAPRPRTFDEGDLRKRHAKNKRVYPVPLKGEAPIDKFEDFARYQLGELVQRGVFIQGVEASCESCGIVNWFPLEEVAAFVLCPGCRRQAPLPLLPSVRLRLNSLVSQAIARDAMVPVLETACKLRYGAREMSVTIPAHELVTDWGGEVVGEVDLLTLVDGSMSIVEVKSKAEGVTAKAIGQLEELANALLPDSVVIAAKGESWPLAQQTMIEALRGRLEARGISVVCMLLEW